MVALGRTNSEMQFLLEREHGWAGSARMLRRWRDERGVRCHVRVASETVVDTVAALSGTFRGARLGYRAMHRCTFFPERCCCYLFVALMLLLVCARRSLLRTRGDLLVPRSAVAAAMASLDPEGTARSARRRRRFRDRVYISSGPGHCYHLGAHLQRVFFLLLGCLAVFSWVSS